ncbi:hypothetical protein V8F20_011304 [Naviculisporaceae sp. PSN 640]
MKRDPNRAQPLTQAPSESRNPQRRIIQSSQYELTANQMPQGACIPVTSTGLTYSQTRHDGGRDGSDTEGVQGFWRGGLATRNVNLPLNSFSSNPSPNEQAVAHERPEQAAGRFAEINRARYHPYPPAPARMQTNPASYLPASAHRVPQGFGSHSQPSLTLQASLGRTRPRMLGPRPLQEGRDMFNHDPSPTFLTAPNPRPTSSSRTIQYNPLPSVQRESVTPTSFLSNIPVNPALFDSHSTVPANASTNTSNAATSTTTNLTLNPASI